LPTGREHLLYAVGAAGVASHAVDHLVTGHEWDFWYAGALILSALTVGLVFVYRSVPAQLRAAIVIPLGAMWAVVAFVNHVLGVVSGAAPTDYTGVLASLGGACMVGAGLRARSTI
jgi:hypothetical protein